MRYVKLGRTGLMVSRICLGCMSYGCRRGGRGCSTRRRPSRSSAGRSRPASTSSTPPTCTRSACSEEVTGRALRETGEPRRARGRHEGVLPDGRRPNMGGLSRKHILQAARPASAGSASTTIDLYQIHRFDPATPIDETLAALDHARQAGQGALHRRQLECAWQFAKALALSDAANGLGALRLDAEPLQPDLPRGGAGDDPALPRRGDRRDPVVAARARAAGRGAEVARRQGVDGPRRQRPARRPSTDPPDGRSSRPCPPWRASAASRRRRSRSPGSSPGPA